MNLGAHAPFCFNIRNRNICKFERKIEIFFHVHIVLILTCVSFHEKVRLYVAYTKITKCLNNTIMIGFVMFTFNKNSYFHIYV
jgi:hypothetical protein